MRLKYMRYTLSIHNNRMKVRFKKNLLLWDSNNNLIRRSIWGSYVKHRDNIYTDIDKLVVNQQSVINNWIIK